MGKIGRNDPCPCGSGKKYKQCCQDTPTAQPADDLWHKLRAIDDQLTHQLLTHAKRLYGYEGLADAWEEFSGGDLGAFVPDSPHNQAFSPWYLYTWMPDTAESANDRADTLTIAQSYLETHRKRLSEMERRLITVVAHQPYSFYEVMACEPGQGFRLRDLLLANEVDVVEHSGAKLAHPGDMVFARVIQFDHVGLMMGCGASLIPPASKPAIIHLRRIIRSQDGALSVEDLHAWDRAIREVYFAIDAQLHRPPELRNTAGDPLCMHELYFEIDSPQYAFDQLKGLAWHVDEAELLHEAELDANGQVRVVEFPWLQSGNAQGAERAQTVLGHIRIAGHQLIASVHSTNRADRIKREIAHRLDNHVRYKATAMQSLTSMLYDAKSRPRRKEEEAIARFNAQPEVQK